MWGRLIVVEEIKIVIYLEMVFEEFRGWFIRGVDGIGGVYGW